MGTHILLLLSNPCCSLLKCRCMSILFKDHYFLITGWNTQGFYTQHHPWLQQEAPCKSIWTLRYLQPTHNQLRNYKGGRGINRVVFIFCKALFQQRYFTELLKWKPAFLCRRDTSILLGDDSPLNWTKHMVTKKSSHWAWSLLFQQFLFRFVPNTNTAK